VTLAGEPTGTAEVVSRETATAGPPPDAARTLFGDRLPLILSYVDLLATAGVERGLIGPREVPRLWERHVLNCGVIAELIPPGASVDDVGSGAGLPGIVLAVQRPDLRIALVEPLLRRTTFLEEAVELLGLRNVLVVRARAEERGRSGPTADVVTARAVAPLPKLAGWCLPLLRPGGALLALKGEAAADEMAAYQASAPVGVAGVDLVTVGEGTVDPPTVVVRIRRSTERIPKRKGRR